MAEVKDKVVTVESLSALHEYNKTKYIDKEDVIPIANGGTGATDASVARSNLGITPENIGASAEGHIHSASDITSGTLSSDRLPTVPIANGGTGATTAAAALTKLGAASASHNHKAESLSPANLEFHPGSSAGHGGYIDFHHNDASIDYTHRIMADAKAVTLNGNQILTTSNIVDLYNLSLTFTNGVATYSNSNIKTGAVVMVQRRGNMAGANTSFCTHTSNGSVTICCESGYSGDMSVNLIITNI